jgi:hypothetical protein
MASDLTFLSLGANRLGLIGADQRRLARGSLGSYIPAAMMKGRIAIPDVDPKTWRSRGRKRKRTQLALACAIVTPAPMKKRRQMTDDQEQRSALRSSSRRSPGTRCSLT